MYRVYVFLTAAVFGAGAVAAGQPAPTAPGPSAIEAFIEHEETAQTSPSRPESVEDIFRLPDSAGLEALDPDTREVALASIREYYRYRQAGYAHRLAVFDWQLQSSKIIFGVMIVLVAAGVYFSGVQFHATLQSAPGPSTRSPEAAASPSDPAAPTSSIEATAGGIGLKVSSPVLGVIILVISFLFFYLYLVHVYPIREIW